MSTLSEFTVIREEGDRSRAVTIQVNEHFWSQRPGEQARVEILSVEVSDVGDLAAP